MTAGLSQCALCARYFQAETQEEAMAAAKGHESEEMADFSARLDARLRARPGVSAAPSIPGDAP